MCFYRKIRDDRLLCFALLFFALLAQKSATRSILFRLFNITRTWRHESPGRRKKEDGIDEEYAMGK